MRGLKAGAVSATVYGQVGSNPLVPHINLTAQGEGVGREHNREEFSGLKGACNNVSSLVVRPSHIRHWAMLCPWPGITFPQPITCQSPITCRQLPCAREGCLQWDKESSFSCCPCMLSLGEETRQEALPYNPSSGCLQALPHGSASNLHLPCLPHPRAQVSAGASNGGSRSPHKTDTGPKNMVLSPWALLGGATWQCAGNKYLRRWLVHGAVLNTVNLPLAHSLHRSMLKAPARPDWQPQAQLLQLLLRLGQAGTLLPHSWKLHRREQQCCDATKHG